MKTNGLGKNYTELNNYYMKNLLKIIGSSGTMNKTAMFWRPGAADSLPQSEIPAGTIFDVYGTGNALPAGVPADYGGTITATTAAGHRVVVSNQAQPTRDCLQNSDGGLFLRSCF